MRNVLLWQKQLLNAKNDRRAQNQMKIKQLANCYLRQMKQNEEIFSRQTKMPIGSPQSFDHRAILAPAEGDPTRQKRAECWQAP